MQSVSGFFSNAGFSTDKLFGYDLRLRRNEIRCAHLGVDSFKIWNGEVSLAGYYPHVRPDRESPSHKETDEPVHAYPPWHTAMFYFYGWIPERLLLSLVSLAMGACLCFVASECVKIAKARFKHYALVSALALALISPFVWNGFLVLNYGVFVLSAFLLMNKAVEKKWDVVAGLAWTVMMVKPHVGLLFFWPLFWRRRYRAIVTAVAVCLAATFATSLILHESVIDLILQVPQIGKPYGSGMIMDKIIKPIVGMDLTFALMPFFFVLTGFVTWLLRSRRDFLFCCLPVVLAISVWTYGQLHDQVILLPAFLFFAETILSRENPLHWWAIVICVCYCAMLDISGAWIFLTRFGLIDPTGKGWVYYLATCSAYPICLVFFLLFFREEFRSGRRRLRL